MKKIIIVLLAAFLPLIFYNYAGAWSLMAQLWESSQIDYTTEPLPPPPLNDDTKPEDVVSDAGKPDPLIDSDLGLDNSAGSPNIDTPQEATAPVPEPATMLLLGSGLVGLATMRKKFAKNR